MRRVNRRLPFVLSIAVVVSLSAGCTTFSDSSNVARVGDATLSDDEFQAQLTELGAPNDQLLPAEAVRAQITTWIQEQVAASDEAGLSSDEVAERYDRGVGSSGTACVSGIVVEQRDTAVGVADELASGTDFTELLEAENLDPSLGEAGGDIGCITGDQIAEAADIEFVQATASLNAENPIDIAPLFDQAGNEFAWVVLQFRPFDALSPTDVDTVTTVIDAAARLAAADVFVDSRYGTFDADTGQVVPLG